MSFVSGELTFSALPVSEVGAFLDLSRRGFVAAQVAAGVDSKATEARADAVHARVFPEGRLNPDHRIGTLIAAGEAVGQLWVARADDSGWYVWDIAINEEHRGRGFGRAAMEIAEEMAREDDADQIGLSVLASNDIAYGLYRSLGYEVVDHDGGPLLSMSKQLRPRTT